MDPREQRVRILLAHAPAGDGLLDQAGRILLALLGRVRETSLSTTSIPAFAETYAIAAPIMPAPSTTIFSA